ncbi:MAG: glutaredoxin domain-containing protein [Opitutae bacterium]|jgi:glutaredoxin|nr:glutaredoxin domain-containing protein [Opitutae bacterium]
MSKPILYIKSQCPWCKDALAFFKTQNIALDVRDVLKTPKDMSDMQTISGQNLTPTFVYDECVIADFSVDEFKIAIESYPEKKALLGL